MGFLCHQLDQLPGSFTAAPDASGASDSGIQNLKIPEVPEKIDSDSKAPKDSDRL